ncbi:MAG: efflux RND transporter permease subunit, partial [Bacteroidota bacterium]
MYRRNSIIIIAIVAVITAAQLFRFQDIKFDYDLTKFFPINSPETDFFLEYSKMYSWDDDFILIGLYNEAGIFEQDFLRQIDSLSKELRRMEEITSVFSPTTINILRKTPFSSGVITRPYITIDDPSKYPADSARIYKHQELVDRLFARDGKSVGIILGQKPKLGVEECKLVTQKVDDLINQIGFKEAHYAGKCFSQTAYTSLVQSEVLLFVGSSVLMIIFFLYLSYRKFWSIWMPLLIIIITVIWAIGTMIWAGESINFISNIIPTILMIIGISNVIHLFTKYRLLIRKGEEQMDALHTAIREVGFATIFTSLTTILSFLTLTTSDVDPLIKLGIYASLGLVFAFILTYSLFPAMLILYKPAKELGPDQVKEVWQPFLYKIFMWVKEHPKAIIASSVAIVAFSIYGTTLLKINNHLVEDLKNMDAGRVATGFFEERFSGTRQYELAISLKDTTKSVFDKDVLFAMEKLETFMEAEFENNYWFSPVSVIKASNRIDHGGNEAYYKLPQSQRKIDKLVREIKRNEKRTSNFPKVYTKDEKNARFSGKITDIGSYEARIRNGNLDQFMTDNKLADIFNYKYTGSVQLNDMNGYNVAFNVLNGLLFCVGFIMLLVGFMFRSFRMSWIAMVANVLPLLIIAGIMGYMDVDIKIPTAVIFILSFGIAVDDSIHFLSKFRLELGKGKQTEEAIRNTFLTTGKAIVVTSLILSGGFLTLALSSFSGTFYIGFFTSLCLIFA